ncbi:MAG: PIN domain-containing protein [Dokdonella sp.]|uniref:type II toxin-antitoxin system VapC family toxin n=1 Tax=Dokdonella sp. TaxID=2291710 RepID=UPI0025BA520F|nr:PIN domain-containing protein [Dokdonella sp.]MBK8122739.1 PIN domain-containing protein [Dokdonella sp.]
MANDKPKIYVESNAIIDLVKHKVGAGIDKERESDAWHLQGMIEAAKAGKVQLLTSSLSIAECTHVRDKDKLEQAKPFFMGLLASGRGGFTLIQPTLTIMEKARDLRWIHGVALSGVDAVHIASALHLQCTECWSRDRKLIQSAGTLDTLGLRVCAPSETRLLPPEYRQGKLRGID